MIRKQAIWRVDQLRDTIFKSPAKSRVEYLRMVWKSFMYNRNIRSLINETRGTSLIKATSSNKIYCLNRSQFWLSLIEKLETNIRLTLLLKPRIKWQYFSFDATIVIEFVFHQRFSAFLVIKVLPRHRYSKIAAYSLRTFKKRLFNISIRH